MATVDGCGGPDGICTLKSRNEAMRKKMEAEKRKKKEENEQSVG
jgi:hypothetical protein